MGSNNDISLKALAKINLGLDVVRRREDGYHEVRMIMQTIQLYDRLDIKRTQEPGIQIQTNLSFLPVNENNLIYKAAKLLMDEFSITDGVSVKLDKRIPVAAGMAGGSTDAAAMLIGVNRLFSLGLTKRQLMERGVQIGADVPYCIMRGTALAEGIGEALSPLPPMVKCPVLIATPYDALVNDLQGCHFEVSESVIPITLDDTTIHPDIDRLIDDIKAKNLHDIAAHMGNVLETVTIPNYPVIDEIKKHMLSNGAVGAMMSGSGPTVFGLFDDEDTAKKAYKAMRSSHLARQVYLTSVYNNRK